MAKKAFIALLFLIAISGIAPPTHMTAANVNGAEAATTPRKLVEKFQDQTVVEEVMIKLPQQVRVPNARFCYPFKYDQCDPGCSCFTQTPFPGICVCGFAVAAAATQEAATTPPKLVEKFQDQTVVEEVMIKLPQEVRVSAGEFCNPPRYDECNPGCLCFVPHGISPPGPGICVCPFAVAAAATEEAPLKMVGNFQDETVEKLIKLPQRVGVPRGYPCSPRFDRCDPGCKCFPVSLPIIGICLGPC